VTVSNEIRRYGLTLVKVPLRERGRFRALSRSETYKEVRPGGVGERVAYSVEMTPREYERARRDAEDPSVNLIAVEEIRFCPLPAVPSTTILGYMAATHMAQNGWNGAGVVIALLDSGLSPTVANTAFAGRISSAVSVVGGVGPYEGNTSHGTFSAGLVAPSRAHLSIIRVVSGEGSLDDDVAKGIYLAIDDNQASGRGVDLVVAVVQNNDTTLLKDASAEAVRKGKIVIAAAGNGGPDYIGAGENYNRYPAAYPGVLAISNFDPRADSIASSSNYGNHIFAAAPGMATTSYAMDGSLEYREDGGTSAATPAAGYAAASLLTRMSPGNVRKYMASTARRTGASPLYEGNGVLQAQKVVQRIRSERPRKRNLADSYIDFEGRLVDENGDLLIGGGLGSKPLLDGCIV
jgi:hypothetical protein